MRKGKYQKPAVAKHRRKRLDILIISLVLLLAAAIGGTVAYLLDSTNQVTNTFIPAEVEITPTEETTPNTKSKIQFKNTGNVPVYVRATLAIYWKDSEGNIVPEPDGGTVILGRLNTNWEQDGDIYYHREAVGPNEDTNVLMDPIQVTVPDGYTCHIDVLSEAIQADGIGEDVDYKTVWTAAKGSN